VALFRAPAATGQPAWDTRRHGIATRVACPDILSLRDLAPSESVHLPLSIPVSSILGDSLPSARYHVFVQFVLLPRASTTRLAGGWISAGAIDLER
jgi:hypothetical protein